MMRYDPVTDRFVGGDGSMLPRPDDGADKEEQT